MAQTRRISAALAPAVAGCLLAGLVGCGRGEFPDRSAVVTLGGSSATYAVVSCGLDGRTVYLVAESPSGAVLQAVVGLDADGEVGVPASSGLSVDADPASETTRIAAFGTEAWERRGGTGAPPGAIGGASLRGARIGLSGTAEAVDAQDVASGGPQTSFSVDARCDDQTG